MFCIAIDVYIIAKMLLVVVKRFLVVYDEAFQN